MVFKALMLYNYVLQLAIHSLLSFSTFSDNGSTMAPLHKTFGRSKYSAHDLPHVIISELAKIISLKLYMISSGFFTRQIA